LAALKWGIVSKGILDHTLLTNIGTNIHTAIDTALTRLANTSGTNTGNQTISDATITTTDITTNNFTTAKHGFVPKGTNVGNFLKDDGTWSPSVDGLTPIIIGGTGTTSTLTLKPTSGVGANGSDIIFQVGNNGSLEAMRIDDTGNVGIGINPLSAQLHVYDSNSGFLYGIKNDYTNTDVAGSGIYNLVTTRKSTSTASGSVGLYLIQKVQIDTGIVNTSVVYGIYNQALRNSLSVGTDDSGSVTSIFCIRNFYGHDDTNTGATPTTTTVHGLLLSPSIKTGTIGVLYDIYIATPTTGGTISGAHYAIYQQDATAESFFAGSIGIGAGIAGTETLRIAKNLTGGTSAYGTYSPALVKSDVTSSAYIHGTQPSTDAAAFVLGSLLHYSAAQGTIGAGSSITNQYGFNASSTLIGATNNFGFLSNLAAGTGRWNFYASGTADNFFAGKVGLGTAADSVTNFRVAIDMTGGTAVVGMANNGKIKSDATGNSFYYGSTTSTEATAFTSTSIAGYKAAQGVFGAGSTVTAQYGFQADATLTGATNNFGFWSNIVAATGRWNFYASGTALNYFAGNILRSQPTPSTADSTATITVAQIATRIITSTTAAAVSMTLPTGALTDIGFQTPPNDASHDWTVINTGATNAVTILAGVAHTVVGNMTVALSSSATFRTRKTASNTYVTYRI
jgi:hypothetical protein